MLSGTSSPQKPSRDFKLCLTLPALWVNDLHVFQQFLCELQTLNLTFDKLVESDNQMSTLFCICVFLSAALEVQLFLQDRKLNPDTARSDRAIALMGPRMRSRRTLTSTTARILIDAEVDPDDLQKHLEGVVPFMHLLKTSFLPWLTDLATELEKPLETKFFANVFLHKFRDNFLPLIITVDMTLQSCLTTRVPQPLSTWTCSRLSTRQRRRAWSRSLHV